MERKGSEGGTNRTGIKSSPRHAQDAVEAAELALPSSSGDASALAQVRVDVAKEVDGLGSVPPPVGFKGGARTAADRVLRGRSTVFIDKLAERAGFERTGVRLYELALSKLEVSGGWEGGPSRMQLERIRRDELSHFQLLVRCIEQLGGDPTALTPAADVAANLSLGVHRVLADPHVNLLQSLLGLLMAELTDNVSWELLLELARDLEHDDLTDDFQRALTVEREHLVLVRGWLSEGTRREAQVGQEAAGAPP